MLCSPVEIVGHDGFVTGITATRMELGEADASGRRAPVCVLGSEFAIDCDTVISAVGTRANPLLSQAAPGLELSARGYIVTDENGTTNLPGRVRGRRHRHRRGHGHPRDGRGQEGGAGDGRWLARRPRR